MKNIIPKNYTNFLINISYNDVYLDINSMKSKIAFLYFSNETQK